MQFKLFICVRLRQLEVEPLICVRLFVDYISILFIIFRDFSLFTKQKKKKKLQLQIGKWNCISFSLWVAVECPLSPYIIIVHSPYSSSHWAETVFKWFLYFVPFLCHHNCTMKTWQKSSCRVFHCSSGCTNAHCFGPQFNHLRINKNTNTFLFYFNICRFGIYWLLRCQNKKATGKQTFIYIKLNYLFYHFNICLRSANTCARFELLVIIVIIAGRES